MSSTFTKCHKANRYHIPMAIRAHRLFGFRNTKVFRFHLHYRLCCLHFLHCFVILHFFSYIISFNQCSFTWFSPLNVVYIRCNLWCGSSIRKRFDCIKSIRLFQLIIFTHVFFSCWFFSTDFHFSTEAWPSDLKSVCDKSWRNAKHNWWKR